MSVAVYQLKIRCEDCNVIAYLSPEEVIQKNYHLLLAKVCYVCPSRFRSMMANDFKVEYVDDEKTLVELRSEDMSIRELFRYATPVENADFKRITLRVFQSHSPMIDNVANLNCTMRDKESQALLSQQSPASLPSKHAKI